MNIGAVLIAAGFGVAPLQPCGGVCAAQRTIASLQKAGVSRITVVTGPNDRKLEKQLAQLGVFFQRSPGEDEGSALAMGLGLWENPCRKLFVLCADRPLLDPKNLQQLLQEEGKLLVPTYLGKRGQPLLLDGAMTGALAGAGSLAALSRAAREISVTDPGVLLTAEDCTAPLLEEHDRKITRPQLELAVCRGKPLLDGKLAELLALIQQTQSVRHACSRMQISYSTAWNMLNTAEDALGTPLVLRNKGGPSGSGSQLTDRGSQLLQAYVQFEAAAREAVEQMFDAHFRDVL